MSKAAEFLENIVQMFIMSRLPRVLEKKLTRYLVHVARKVYLPRVHLPKFHFKHSAKPGA